MCGRGSFGILVMITNLDFLILDIIKNLRCGILDFVMPYITSLGNGGIIWIIAGLLMLCFKKTRKTGITVLISLLLSLIFCNLLIKPNVMRTRPFNLIEMELLIAPPNDFSFPSGHASSSFAAAVSMYLNNKQLGRWAILLASLIAFSRLYLYVHFPTDVLAGIVLGTILAFCAKKVTGKLKGI